ncbi:MAG: ADP-ribosylglycohydrolase family protein [Firmicutes bacterium]|nr:ADP-ribosylglycohydrolase family protein [Bacillota bacterium]
MNKNDKIRGSLIGGAVGDALGYPVEFANFLKDKEVTRFQDKGIISDDTQMTLFTANALIWRETRVNLRGIAMQPSDAIFLAYKDWYSTQSNYDNENSISWIKILPELNVQRAPGNTCLSALSSNKKGTIDEPINNSKGCGGVMRVAPIGMYIKNPEKAGIISAEASAITHGHALGVIPAYVFAVLINYLINNDISIEDALNKSMDLYNQKFNKYELSDKIEFINIIQKVIELSKKKISDVEAIKLIGEGWVAEEAFAIAIYSCLKYPNSFEDAIVCAINHGGDSDSTGAIAGNIMGAHLGYSKIPNYYVEDLELKDVILELADDMSIDVPVSEYKEDNDKYWLSKYLYCSRDINLKNKG